MNVLLVEDAPSMQDSLMRGLQREGFAVDTANDSEQSAFKARTGRYDIIVLDLPLPHSDGIELVKEWGRSHLPTHVVVLTPIGSSLDRVQILNHGADACLSKPFAWEELLARLRSLMRRSRHRQSTILRVDELEIDSVRCVVRRGEQTIPLTPREFALLQFLIRNRGSVVTREQIRKHLYDGVENASSNVVDVYIRYLRRKIDKGFDKPLILTRWGEGYLFRDDRLAVLP